MVSIGDALVEVAMVHLQSWEGNPEGRNPESYLEHTPLPGIPSRPPTAPGPNSCCLRSSTGTSDNRSQLEITMEMAYPFTYPRQRGRSINDGIQSDCAQCSM